MHPSTILSLLTLAATSTTATAASSKFRRQSPQQGPGGEVNPTVANMLTPDMIDPIDPGDGSFFPLDFGVQPGQLVPGSQVQCQTGPGGVPIPCHCPPDPNNATFRAAVKIALNQGFFPVPRAKTDIQIEQWNDVGSTDEAVLKGRAQAQIVAFQSLSGNEGVFGCPAASAPVLSNRAEGKPDDAPRPPPAGGAAAAPPGRR